MKPDQLTQDLAMIARNAIDYIRELERERAELLEALKFIADHDLRGTDLIVSGHMAHGFIGRARAAVSAFEGEKQ